MGTKTTQYSDLSDAEARRDDHGAVVDDVATHTVALDGEAVEFECLDSEWDDIRAALTGYLGEGFNLTRKPVSVGASRSGRSRSSGSSGSSSGGSGGRVGAQGLTRTEGKTCRAWAREQGYEVTERGRIPNDVVEEWAKAGKPSPKSQPIESPNVAEGAPDGDSDAADNTSDVEQAEQSLPAPGNDLVNA